MEREVLLNEARYAERLCQRTARLYRHLQAAGTFLTVVGGSAALSALSSRVPPEVSLWGAAVFTLFGGAMLAIRPADKAANNEADARRYAKLRAEAHDMGAGELARALDNARTSDTPEVELLRDVAYNDLAVEVGQPSYVVPLSLRQRLLAAIA